MVAHVNTVAFSGINALRVDVQVHISSGMPVFQVVGLPDKTVAESRERVRAAICSLGLSMPAKRIIVNLAPADLTKEGSHYDLPIAIGLLQAMDIIDIEDISEFIAIGELSLDGNILPVSGTLPSAILAQELSFGIICPKVSGHEAAWAGNLPIIAASSLIELINHFKGIYLIPRPEVIISEETRKKTNHHYVDIKNVKGQHLAKRSLEIAAAGGHNLLMNGAPGSGKSMLASCLRTILPPLTSREILEISMIESVSGNLSSNGLKSERPFRDPHHSCSLPALIGGGANAKPGEVSFAHSGVLFLDELPEFSRHVLDSLRQPIETGYVTIARAKNHATYPANFQLIAAMNPCKCGYLFDPSKSCSKAPRCGVEYQSRLSGPFLDRIDLYIEVQPVSIFEYDDDTEVEDSKTIAKRIAIAREIQVERYRNYGITSNSKASNNIINEFVEIDDEINKMLKEAMENMGLSMRAVDRITRVARTIADLEESEKVYKHHFAEAINYRIKYV